MSDLHKIKCDARPFTALDAGTKTHEVRIFDRDYKVGDILEIIQDRGPDTDEATGTIWATIEHITKPGTYGLNPATGVMSIKVFRKSTRVRTL